MSFPLTLSDAAKSRLQVLARQKPGAVGIMLRIAKGKGCGGNEYRMDYMTEEKPGFDKVEAGPDTALYIPISDSLHMFGMAIDFEEDDLGNNKFLFINPNEAGRCGCGESFSLDPDQKMDETGACGVR